MLKWLTDRFKTGGATATPLDQAQALRLQGDAEAARAICQQLLRDEPGNARALAMMGAICADQGQADSGMQWVRQALDADRDCIPAHFAMGRLYDGLERHADAEACYRRVLALDPRHAKARTNLGTMLHIQGRLDEAVACYRQALALEPGQPEALRNFALVAGGAKELKEAREGFERHLAASPKDGPAHAQLAHLYVRLGLPALAQASYERAIALEPEQAEYHFGLAQVLLLRGRYAQGWREYEWRWRMERFNTIMFRFPQPRWDGRPLNGTLLIHGEPGFGDVFQFIRYAALAAGRGARVVVQCHPALAELVAGVEGVAKVVREGEALPPFDAHIPLIALAGVFDGETDAVTWRGPYIRADAQRASDWTARVAATAPRKRKVGMVWTGDPTNAGNRERSVTLQQLAALATPTDVTFFSLQKGVAVPPGEVPAGMDFRDLTGEIRNFSDTAALLAQLDLVITVDTGVAHLAGAMGRPTWVLLPFSAPWRYHLGEDNPWYPGMRLFRQETDGDWSLPLQRLGQALFSTMGSS